MAQQGTAAFESKDYSGHAASEHALTPEHSCAICTMVVMFSNVQRDHASYSCSFSVRQDKQKPLDCLAHV